MSRSVLTPRARAASAHSTCRDAYPLSVSSCRARVSMIIRASLEPPGLSGTESDSPLRQSSSSACPAWQSSAADWSMMPVGTPTKSFSARRAIAASSVRGTSSPASWVRASATAHSRAADEDSPAPCGRSESMASRAPGTGYPARPSAQATPAA